MGINNWVGFLSELALAIHTSAPHHALKQVTSYFVFFGRNPPWLAASFEDKTDSTASTPVASNTRRSRQVSTTSRDSAESPSSLPTTPRGFSPRVESDSSTFQFQPPAANAFLLASNPIASDSVEFYNINIVNWLLIAISIPPEPAFVPYHRRLIRPCINSHLS